MTNLPYAVQASRFENIAPDTSVSLPHALSVTVSTANTKGGYTQLIAATGQPADGIILYLFSSGTNSAQILLDIAIGAAGLEKIIVSDLFLDYERFNTAGAAWQVFIPVHIPEGVRLAAQMQSNETAQIMKVGVVLVQGGHYYPKGVAGVVGEGLLTSASRGTDIDPGAVANTKEPYVQLIASTAFNYGGFFLTYGWSSNSAATLTTSWLIDVAIGAAAAEIIIVPDSFLLVDLTADHVTYNISPVFNIPIPAGTRVAVQAQSNETNATDRLFDLTFNGLLL